MRRTGFTKIIASAPGKPTRRAVLRRFDPEGTTDDIAFDTRKETYETSAAKCPLNFVVCDTKDWEQKVAQTLESMPEVVRYVKNERLGFTIPYTMGGQVHQYTPDFVVCIDDGRGPHDLLQLLVECSGKDKVDKQIKIEQTREFWVPGVNALGDFGRWDIIEIKDPWNCKNAIHSFLSGRAQMHPAPYGTQLALV